MAIQERVSGGVAYIQSAVNSVVSPSTRERYYNNIAGFAKDRPLIFTFLATQLLLTFTPLAIFLSFVLGTLVLSIVTALLFTLFWLGVALLVLIPTLFLTVSLALAAWIWAVGSFLVARWAYNLVLGDDDGGGGGRRGEQIAVSKVKKMEEVRNGA